VPVRLRRVGMGIRMPIDGADPFTANKT